MDSLLTKPSAQAMLDAAAELPERLEKRYREAVKSIPARPSYLKSICESALLWLSCALRPLTVNELQKSLSVQRGDKMLNKMRRPIIATLVSACQGLVIVDPENNQIRLFHQTTYEYFEKYPITDCAHTVMAETCLKYLLSEHDNTNSCENDEDMNIRLESYPLLEYAAKEWGNHYARMSSKSSKTVQNLALRFLRHLSNLEYANQAKSIPTCRNAGYSQQFTKHVSGLQVAASFGLESIVRQLLQNEFVVRDLRNHDLDGRTAVHSAAENGRVDVMKLLEEAGADLDATDYNCATVLHISVWQGHYNLSRKLLSQISIHCKDKNGFTPLHFAADQGRKEMIDLLIEHNANVEAMTDQGYWTPLHVAATKGHDINLPGVIKLQQQQSPLGSLFRVGMTLSDLPDYFVGQHQGDFIAAPDAPYDANDCRGLLSHFRSASRSSMPATLAMQDDITAQRCSANCRHEDTIEMLLDNGANMTKTCRVAWVEHPGFQWHAEATALHLAIMSRHEKIVRALLQRGSDIHLMCRVSQDPGACVHLTALQLAIAAGHDGVLQLILEQQDPRDIHTINNVCHANYNASLPLDRVRLHIETTALHFAAVHGFTPSLQLLLQRGADGSKSCTIYFDTDNAGKQGYISCEGTVKATALHFAAAAGSENSLRLLMDQGVATSEECTIDLTTRNIPGTHRRSGSLIMKTTAIHLVTIIGSKPLLRLLLCQGVSVNEECSLKFWGDMNSISHTWSANIKPLHFACIKALRSSCRQANQGNRPDDGVDVGAVQQLLENGAEIDATLHIRKEFHDKTDGITGATQLTLSALHILVLCWDMTQETDTRALLEQGAQYSVPGKISMDLGLRPKAGWQPHFEMTAELSDFTALHFSALFNRKEMAQLFLNEDTRIIDDESILAISCQLEGGEDGNPERYTHPSINLSNAPFRIPSRDDSDVLQILVDSIRSTIHNVARVNVGFHPVTEVYAVWRTAARANFKINGMLTPLHLAILQGSEKVAEVICTAGCDVNRKCTAEISVDCSVKSTDIVSLHVSGEITPLHLASLLGNGALVSCLLGHRASIHHRCADGRKAIDLARDMGHKSVVDLIA